MNDHTQVFAPFIATMGPRGLFMRSVHVWQKPAFVYFNNPKVVSSSTKAGLNRAIARRFGIEMRYDTLEGVHERGVNPMKTPEEVGQKLFARLLRDPAVTRFAFVRDPLSRLISAYADRLSTSGGAQKPPFARLAAHLGLKAGAELSFADFARLCADDPAVRDFDPHWRLQRRQIAFDLVPYSFVGHHESWSRDFAAITAAIFGAPVQEVDTRAAFGHFTDAARKPVVTDAATRALVERAYAQDYAMLEEIAARGLDRTPAGR